MTPGFPNQPPAWWRYLRFWRRDAHADTDQEIRAHLDARIEDLVRSGQSLSSARSQALLEFGDLDQVRTDLREIDRRIERHRSSRERLASILDDLRYSIRSLARTPGLVVTIVLTMALGLGANSAMFTFVDALFLRPPSGVRDPGSIRRLWVQRNRTPNRVPVATEAMSYPQYTTMVSAAGPDAQLTAYADHYVRVGKGASAERIVGSSVDTNYFTFFGARILAGRPFSAAENRFGSGVQVAMISAALRDRLFGVDADVLGRQIPIDGKPFTIIGVVARDFTGPNLSAVDLWMPLATISMYGDWWRDTGSRPTSYFLRAFLRLSPAANARQLVTRLTASGQGHERRTLFGDTLMQVMLTPINEARAPGDIDTRRDLDTEVNIATRLAGVAGIVLLIACANVINLLLGRAIRRRREIAVRRALGMSRARLARMMVTESVVLTTVGGVVAVLAAYWGGTLLRTLLLPDIHWPAGVLNLRVVWMSLLASGVAGVGIGLIPAMRSSDPDLNASLKAGGREGSPVRSRLRALLVSTQAALAVVLLVAAALFVTSLRNVEGINIGFDAGRLLFINASFDPDAAPAQSVQDVANRKLADEMTGVPGVEGVATSFMTPMYGFSFETFFLDQDSAGLSAHLGAGAPATPSPTVDAVSPTYFTTVGRKLREGRFFPQDRGTGVGHPLVVNEAMAKYAWPRRSPIGECVRFSKRTNPCYTVIGVVENAHLQTVIEKEARPDMYVPLENAPNENLSHPYVVIVRADPNRMAAVAADATNRVRRLLPSAYPHVDRMTAHLDGDYRPFRVGASLFSMFGILALVVAVIGIYSTVSYGVSQRRHEFGVRVALGARLNDVIRLVVGEELRVVGVGVLVGLGLALAAGRLIASLLYEVSPHDPAAMSLVTVLLLGASVLASLGPAWRAGNADPVSVLRED